MKKSLKLFSLVLVMVLALPTHTDAEKTFEMPKEDSTQLQYQDMSMLFLGPYIDKAVADYYSSYLTKNPIVYPYMIELLKIERIKEFREFHFLITLNVIPVLGPHISVGKDQLIFEVAPTLPNSVKLRKFKHLETHDLPSVWQHLLREKPHR